MVLQKTFVIPLFVEFMYRYIIYSFGYDRAVCEYLASFLTNLLRVVWPISARHLNYAKTAKLNLYCNVQSSKCVHVHTIDILFYFT